MNWPFLTIDNFFRDPHGVVEFSKTLQYEDNNIYPGPRTVPPLHEQHSDFFNWVGGKVLALLYPNEWRNIQYNAEILFQRVVPNRVYDGWVHRDSPCEFTAICYLSDIKGAGTSIYKPKQGFALEQHDDIKCAYNAGEINDVGRYKAENNDQFEEVVRVESNFNRIMLFDSYEYHAAQPFISHNDDDQERLTMIAFFNSVELPNSNLQLKAHGAEAKRL